MRVFDDQGQMLDANVEIETAAGSAYAVTFESRGPRRNSDYIPAFRLVLARLAQMSATLVDAVLVTRDTMHLPVEQRRLAIRNHPYPIGLSPDADVLRLAAAIRTAQAKTGREEGAKGTGNRTKRTRIEFELPMEGATLALVVEHVLNPTGGVELLAITDFVRPRARKGQGLASDPEARWLAEDYSMQRAVEHFTAMGAEVEDVSRHQSFDLRCKFKDKSVVHVEVKGTTTTGKSVLLTPNEVLHARIQFPKLALFVVSEIEIRIKNGIRVATGGIVRVLFPWKLNEELLSVSSFNLELE